MSQSPFSSPVILHSNSNLIFVNYSLSVEAFESKYDCEQISEIWKLLGCMLADPTINIFKYTQFPLIICKKDNTEVVDKQFLNPVLFQVSISI